MAGVEAERAISIAATHPPVPQAPEGGELQPHRQSWPSRQTRQGPADDIIGGVRMCTEPRTCGVVAISDLFSFLLVPVAFLRLEPICAGYLCWSLYRRSIVPSSRFLKCQDLKLAV